MAQLIRNMDDLQKLINNQVIPRAKYPIQQTAEEVEQMVRDYVMQTLYSLHPYEYDRTYEFVNSIVHTKPIRIKNGWMVEIYYDTDLIKATYVENGWNQHMSFSGEDVSTSIPLWLEYGTDNPYYSHEGINAMKTIATWDVLIKKKLVEYLRKNGLNAKVK